MNENLVVDLQEDVVHCQSYNFLLHHVLELVIVLVLVLVRILLRMKLDRTQTRMFVLEQW